MELYSSDLRRAWQTAEVIGDLLLVEPVADRRLREQSYGDAEGKPQEWLDQRFIRPPEVGERMRHDEGVQGAETIARSRTASTRQWMRSRGATVNTRSS